MTPMAALIDNTRTVAPASKRRLAYLLSSYPAISHTFFLNEVLALRRLGFVIDVASINIPPRPSGDLPPREAKEMDTTFYVKSTSKLRAALLILKSLALHPRVFLRGLLFSVGLAHGNLYATFYSLFYFVEALIVGDWMLRRGHNHLHIHFGGSVATVGMVASVAWKIPYSLMIHGPEEFYNIEKTLLVQKVNHASFVFCISNYCRSQIMRVTSPEQWSKLHIVRLGVDPELFTPRAKLGIAAPIEVLCVGRLVPDKGQLILLEAFTDLLERGHTLRLRFVGEGPDRPRLERFIAQHNLTSMAVMEGALNHDDTRLRLKDADIFVLPSFAEGVPVALMEAMAMAIPCVSTFVAGIPELIEDGVSGLLVPPSSQRMLADAIERLALDDNLRRNIASAGRARVIERYNLTKNAATLASRFESCLPEFDSTADAHPSHAMDEAGQARG